MGGWNKLKDYYRYRTSFPTVMGPATVIKPFQTTTTMASFLRVTSKKYFGLVTFLLCFAIVSPEIGNLRSGRQLTALSQFSDPVSIVMKNTAVDGEAQSVANPSPQATIVTAYFNVKSKHRHSVYVEWMENMLSLQDPMVIYTTPNMVPVITRLRSHAPDRTKVVPMKLEDMRMSQYGNEFWERQHEMDPEKAIHKTYYTYWIWAEKLEFLRRAIEENPFQSEFFAWVDIGYFRTKGYNNMSILQQIPTTLQRDQILGLDSSSGIKPMIMGGGFIGGYAGGLMRFHSIYYYLLEANKDKFIGKDQEWYQKACNENDGLCMLVQPRGDRFDPLAWMAVANPFQATIVTVYQPQLKVSFSGASLRPHHLSDPEATSRSQPMIHFRTYGSADYELATQRILREADETGWFQTMEAWGPDDLPKEFSEKFKDVLSMRRGGGYWIWKYPIIEETLKIMRDGDMMVFLDAGCQLNPLATKRFQEYVQDLQNSIFDVQCHQLTHLEHLWTTERIFESMGVEKNNTEIRNIGQLVGGVLMIKKGPHARRWLDLIWGALDKDPYLVTDNYNDEAKWIDPEFIDNRHDQSISSVARKQVGCIVYPDESFLPRQPDKPFWASRMRSS